MITIADLQPKPRMSEEEYLRLITKDIASNPEQADFAARQAAHHRHLGRIWYERSVDSREGGYIQSAIAEQAASARCYWRARLYSNLGE